MIIFFLQIRPAGAQDSQVGSLGPGVPQRGRLRRRQQGQLRRHQGGHGTCASPQWVLGWRALYITGRLIFSGIVILVVRFVREIPKPVHTLSEVGKCQVGLEKLIRSLTSGTVKETIRSPIRDSARFTQPRQCFSTSTQNEAARTHHLFRSSFKGWQVSSMFGDTILSDNSRFATIWQQQITWSISPFKFSPTYVLFIVLMSSLFYTKNSCYQGLRNHRCCYVSLWRATFAGMIRGTTGNPCSENDSIC